MTEPSERAPSPRLGYRDVMALPDVARLMTASSVSRLAEAAFTLAIVLYALERFASAPVAGLVAFAAVAPGLLLSPLGGALLDRIGPARAIGADLLVSTVLVVALATSDLWGPAGPAPVVVTAALYSVTSPLHIAGVRALLPRLVPPHALERVNGVDAGSFAVVDVLGPLVAGGAVALAGGRAALLAVAAFYLVGTVLLLPLATRAPERTRDGIGVTRLLRDAGAGLAYLVRHPTLRALALSYSLYQVCWGVLVVTVPVAVSVAAGPGGSTGSADVVTGAMWALVGAAAVVGALAVGRLDGTGRERRWILLGTLGSAVAIYPVAGLGGIVWLAVGLALFGLVSGPVDVGTLTLRQRRTDPAQLSRVLAVSISANLSGLPLGALLGGLVVARSLPAAFAMAAAAAAAAALCTLAMPGPQRAPSSPSSSGS